MTIYSHSDYSTVTIALKYTSSVLKCNEDDVRDKEDRADCLSMMQSGLNESIYKWALFSQIHFGVQWLKRLRRISGGCYVDLDLTDNKNYVLKLAENQSSISGQCTCLSGAG